MRDPDLPDAARAENGTAARPDAVSAPPAAAARGSVVRGLPRSLESHDEVTIGADPGCDIVVKGADRVHATLCWDAARKAWILRDAPAPAGTAVNGAPSESAVLEAGDWFDVAGVRIRHDGAKLEEIDSGAPVGLRVSLGETSATAGKKRLLDGISFEAAPGAFVAILGPSGCGKSTLIQRIAGLAPYGGHIRFNGHELAVEKGSLVPLLAYLPQAVEDTFHADMRVEEEAENFARVYLGGEGTADFRQKFRDVELSWDELRGKAVRELSGGQKRRLALVLALLRNPQLLLLDEPTAGLDPAAEAGVMALLRRLADQGRTVFCATHVLGSLDLCDEVLVLAPDKDGGGGRQAFHGTPRDALAHFGAAGWLGVYQALEAGEWSPAREEAPAPPAEKQLPAPPRKATFRDAFAGTFPRLARGAVRGWPLSLGIPVGVAAILAWACGNMFGKLDSQGTVCFCMSVAVFWLGLSGTVRSLVAERVPKRCLDRMRGMPLAGYFAAHAAFAAAGTLVQAFLFTAVVFAFRHSPVFAAGAAPAFLAVLWLTAFAGGCAGLALGAACKRELQAVLALPLAAILALFLSEPVLGKKPEGSLAKVEAFMPTLHGQKCLEGELRRWRVEDFSNAEAWREFLLRPAALYLLFLPLAMGLQNRREKQWDGR